MIQPLRRTVCRFLKKKHTKKTKNKNNLGLKLSYNSAIPLPGIYPEETITEKDTRTPMFIAALFIIVRTWKQPRCPLTDEWISKL